MSFAGWSAVIGMVLLSLVLLGTLIGRLPLSGAMLYLGIGWLLGPTVLGVLTPEGWRRRRRSSR